ncbi:MAG: cob(I)yrinic acid a,c-diamide adenosyltransferase [Candidatus Portnoybacteria bacterium]|nr:cob(I)yrinic acid a,c-diamide adenosyltransferase [Candidatus Portnoybacteria bacterium]
MIHIYTGNGKGKTTAALGLGLRAIGASKKVLLIQFLKDGQSSEIKGIKKLPNFDTKAFGRKGFLNKNKLTKKDFDPARRGFLFAKKAIQSKKYNLIILDEINIVINLGLLKIEEVIDLIKKAPLKTELILTGRNANKKLIQSADLVTEMKEIKHYYKKGVKARKGIEF